jgi:hypothetical protein
MATTVKKLLPMRASADINGNKLTVDYLVRNVEGATPEAKTIAAMSASGPDPDTGVTETIPGINGSLGGLTVSGKTALLAENERDARVTVEATPSGTRQQTARAASQLNVWIKEGSATSVATVVTKDKNGADITLKYQPTGKPDVGTDPNYNWHVQFPSTDGRITLTFRRLTNSNPGPRAVYLMNKVHTGKLWKWVSSSFPQTASSPAAMWEESHTFAYSPKGWPEECAYWQNTTTNKVPSDVTLANENTAASIGTSGKGSVRPDLFTEVNIESYLGITF